MGEILLQGQTKDSVYKWPKVTSKSSPLLSFFAGKTTSFEWHHRLGHPLPPILKHITSSFKLELSNPCNDIQILVMTFLILMLAMVIKVTSYHFLFQLSPLLLH